MSLIDPKHFLAPFKNTVHIITIVFTVLLFAVFRLATGGVDVVEGRPLPSPSAARLDLPGASPLAGEDRMQQMLGTGSNRKAAAPDNANDLSEVERALGITK